MSPIDRLINKGLYFRERPIALHKQSGLIALIAIARLQLHSSIHSLSHDFLYMTHQHDYILFNVALKKNYITCNKEFLQNPDCVILRFRFCRQAICISYR